MAITKTTVTGPIVDATGAAYQRAYLRFSPNATGGDDAADTVIARGPVEVQPDETTGAFSIELAPSDDISYTVDLFAAETPQGGASVSVKYRVGLIQVPALGPVALQDLLPIYDPSLPTNAELLAALSAAVAEAEAAADIAVAAATPAAELIANVRVTRDEFSELASVTASDLDVGEYARVMSVGAIYQRAPDGATDVDFDYSSGAGVKWNLITADEITPQVYGWQSSGTATGRTEALQSWFSSGRHITLPPGDWLLNGSLSTTSMMSIDSRGGSFAPEPGATFSEPALLNASGSVSALPDLASNVLRDTDAIPFASAHGLSIGDVFSISNPTDNSWTTLPGRPNYRSGEMCRVTDVPSATTVIIKEPLYDPYTASEVDLYKLNPVEVSITGNLKVDAPTDSATEAIKIVRSDRAKLYGVDATGSGARTINFDQCIDTELHNCSAFLGENTAIIAANLEYGLVFQGCHGARVIGGSYHGQRHGITTVGSEELEGGVVNRGIIVDGADISSTEGFAADFHGNTEFSGYYNCNINGGINLRGGRGMKSIGNTVRGSEAMRLRGITSLIRSDEMKSFDRTIVGCTIYSNADYNASSLRGAIDISGSESFSEHTVEGGTVLISDIKSDCPNTNKMIEIRNRGCTQDTKVIIDNMDFGISTQAGAQLVRVLTDSPGADPKLVKVTNVFDPNQNNMAIDADRIIMDSQSGTEPVTLPTNSSQIAVVVTFPQRYEAIPSVRANTSVTTDNGTGSTGIICAPISVSESGCTFRISTADGSDFAAATSLSIYWESSLN